MIADRSRDVFPSSPGIPEPDVAKRGWRLRKAIRIGSPCPQISKESIVSSFAALKECDGILGPTRDGGYYLLGLKESRPALFQNIPWRTGQVPEKTLNILKIQSLSYISLVAFSDVDTLEDHERVRHLEPLKHLGIG